MRRRTLPSVTPLQFVFLCALIDGKKPGKRMRARLRQRRAYKSLIAFYGVIRRLKDTNLVTSSKDEADLGGYLVQERIYELTKAGRAAVAKTRRFYGNAARRSRRRRWQRKHKSRLCAYKNQTAERAGADA
jgi:DNA-binding PadR family transcriptional regulator